jgi:hypothetical protein
MNISSTDRYVQPASTGARPLLRGLLAFDAATCILFGAALVGFSAFAARLTGLPPALLFEAGWFLLVFGALVAWAASRPEPSRLAVLAIVDVNLLWALACGALLVFDAATATTLGKGLVAVQALAVAALGLIELQVWRRG